MANLSWLAKLWGLELKDKVQVFMLFTLIVTLIVSVINSNRANEDANIRQRAYVGMTNVEAEFQQQEGVIEENKEILFQMTYSNKGLSTAEIEYIKQKVYYVKFNENSLSKATNAEEPMIVDLEAMLMNESDYKDIILIPGHSTTTTFMSHARTLKKALKQYNSFRPLPILVEMKIKYRSLGRVLYHNSLSYLYWFPSNNDIISHRLYASSKDEKPLHFDDKFHYEVLMSIGKDYLKTNKIVVVEGVKVMGVKSGDTQP